MSLEFCTSFVSFSRHLSSETDSGKCVYSSSVSRRRDTGETIAEAGKEALKTIDWSTTNSYTVESERLERSDYEQRERERTTCVFGYSV